MAPLGALAHRVLLAGLIADRIFFHAARLSDFKADLAVVVAFLLVVMLAPLLLVSPHLGLARRLLNGSIRTLWVQLHFLGQR
jgi:hypothetical protein